MSFQHLLTGHDTIECAYYLMRENGCLENGCLLDFESFAVQKEELARAKIR